jgi:type I restriction enzyme, S subunit
MSRDRWHEYQVADIADPQRWALNGGPFGSKLVSSMYVVAGVPVIRGCNLPFDRVFDETEFVFVTNEKAEELRQHAARPGDIVITQRGTLGQVGLIPTNCAFPRYIVSQSQMKLSVDQAKANPRFVYYYFRSPSTMRRIEDLALRAGVPHINLSILRSFPIELPGLHLQRRIASFLATYDDLMEVNRRRIAILEEMARRIYEQWFVRETESWTRKRLDEVIDVDPTTRVPREGLKPFVPMTSVQNTSMLIGEVERRDGNSGSKFQSGDTLLARITPCLENGKTGLVDFLTPDEPVGFGSTEFIVMRGRSVPPEFVQLLARSDPFRAHAIASMSGATGRQRVRRESLEQYEIAVPPVERLIEFSELVGPMFRLARVLFNQITNLAAQRDLLLPKLISGEIDVSEIPAIAEAAE